jgi:hypothetical protein
VGVKGQTLCDSSFLEMTQSFSGRRSIGVMVGVDTNLV